MSQKVLVMLKLSNTNDKIPNGLKVQKHVAGRIYTAETTESVFDEIKTNPAIASIRIVERFGLEM